MSKNLKPRLLDRVTQAATKLSKTHAANKFRKAEASAVRNAGRAQKMNAKVNIIKARQGIAKTRARSAAITASVASMAEAKKEAARANANAYKNALDNWNAIINAKGAAAEGTGEASDGKTNGGSNTGSDLVGE